MNPSEIEMLRYEEPLRSVAAARNSLVNEVDPGVCLQLACELGSSLRASGRLAEAHEVLQDVLQVAKKRSLNVNVSEALWRISTVLVGFGHLEEAIIYADSAGFEAGLVQAQNQLGRSLFARALALHHLGRIRDSLQDCLEAKRFLSAPIDMANLALAISHNASLLGISQKFDFLQVDYERLPEALRLDYQWFLSKRVENSTAIGLLESVFKGQVRRENWPNAALAGVSLVRRLAEGGQEAEARRAAAGLCSLVFHLEKSPLASRCLADLISAAMSHDHSILQASISCDSGLANALRRNP